MDRPGHPPVRGGRERAPEAGEGRARAGGLTARGVPGGGAPQNELAQKWLQMDPGIKDQIKQSLLATLAAQQVEAGRASAQVIAEVAAIEIPVKQWVGLVKALHDNLMGAGGNVPLMLATLDALGYTCEALQGMEVLEQPEVDMILTSVIQGMKAEAGKSIQVRLAGARAFLHAVEFASKNFTGAEHKHEQQYMMQMVFEAAVSHEDVQLRQISFECLVIIAAEYYEHLQDYLTHMFQISCQAIKQDEEPVALQAIEIWSTIAEYELELAEEIQDGNTDVTTLNITVQAAASLIPVILETLTKQEDEEDDGEWNLSKAGAVCLGLVAGAIGDEVIKHVMPFISANMQRPEWNFRDAATLSLGYILDGPSEQALTQIVPQALPHLLQRLKEEPSVRVRETTAWTLGRICQFVHGPHIDAPVLDKPVPGAREGVTGYALIVNSCLESVADDPKVAEQICSVVYHLASGFEEVAGNSPLSPFFPALATKLLECAARPTPGSAKLQLAAYDALNELIRCSTADSANVVNQLIQTIMQKLSESFALQPSTLLEKEGKTQLQGLLCGVIQTIIQKLSMIDEAATKGELVKGGLSDHLMQLFLQVLNSDATTLNEEALRAVGALSDALGGDFAKYMEAFFPVLQRGLVNYAEYQVCSTTVGIVQDLCRSLRTGILPYCNHILKALYDAAVSQDLNRAVKPVILASFGEVADAIEDQFQPFLSGIIEMLKQAAQLTMQTAAQIARDPGAGDEETIEYNNVLRESILSSCSSIFQALKANRALMGQVRDGYGAFLLEFVQNVYQDPAGKGDDGVVKAAVGLLGDMADTMDQIQGLLGQRPDMPTFVRECQQHSDESIRQTAVWVEKCFRTKHGI